MSSSPAVLETEQILLTVPKTVVERAERIARRARLPVESVLAQWLDRVSSELAIEGMDDEELLAVCELTLSSSEQAELDALLAESREGRLDEAGKVRLDDRMREYDRLLLRKSQALREAVARGLLEPLAA